MDTHPDTRSKGQFAEQRAADYLRQQGVHIVQRNYRCSGGEIDIIAQDGRTLLFVEVRYRTPSALTSAADSITPSKQKRLILAARHYLMTLESFPICRFDAILLEGHKLIWEKNCFQIEP